METLKQAKSLGFSDKDIATVWKQTEEEIYLLRKEKKIYPEYLPEDFEIDFAFVDIEFLFKNFCITGLTKITSKVDEITKVAV